MALKGAILVFCVVWFGFRRFRMMRRSLAYLSERIRKIYTMMISGEDSLGHGPVHLLLESAAEIGFA